MQIKDSWVLFPHIFNTLNVMVNKEDQEKNGFDQHMELIEKIDTIIKNSKLCSDEPVTTLHEKSNFVEHRQPIQKALKTTLESFQSDPAPSRKRVPDKLRNSIENKSNFRFIHSLEELSLPSDNTNETHIEFIDLPPPFNHLQTTNSKIKIEPFHENSMLEKPIHFDETSRIEIVDIAHFKNPIANDQSTEAHHIEAFSDSTEEDNILSTKKLSDKPGSVEKISTEIENQKHQDILRKPRNGKKRIHFKYHGWKKHLLTNKNQSNENKNDSQKIDQLYYVSSSINSSKPTKPDDVDDLQKELEHVQKEIQEKQQKLKEAERKAREQKILAEKQRRAELKNQKEQERLTKIEAQKKLKEKKIQEREKQLKQKQKEREQLLKQKAQEKEELKKQKEQERLIKIEAQKKLKEKKEQELKQKQKEREQLLKQKTKEQEELRIQKEAEKIAKKKETEMLIQQALQEKEQKMEHKTRIKMRRHPAQPETTTPSESTTPEPQESPDQPKPTLVAKLENTKKSTPSDSEVIEVLNMLDKLLADLPEETIQHFAKSKDFALYEKIMSRYKQK